MKDTSELYRIDGKMKIMYFMFRVNVGRKTRVILPPTALGELTWSSESRNVQEHRCVGESPECPSSRHETISGERQVEGARAFSSEDRRAAKGGAGAEEVRPHSSIRRKTKLEAKLSAIGRLSAVVSLRRLF